MRSIARVFWPDNVSPPKPITLPEPDEIARAHSLQLQSCINGRLQNGLISFADYMHMALYEPGLGYYMAGSQKFGAQGDFVTAPEVSTLFGQCVAVQAREVLNVLGQGSVLELGAGSGRLAASVCSALVDKPPEHYFILEPSAELQQRQKQRLRDELTDELFHRVVWLDTLPENFVGVCIANEVMDALPVELFTFSNDEFLQVCVQAGGDGLSFTNRAAPEHLQSTLIEMQAELGSAFVDGYRSEMCCLLSPWIASLSDSMKKGVLLLSDYGYPRREYYLPERTQGTVACYYQHHFHDDVFFYPGLQDITAHVDFTRVVEAGSEAGLALLGYTSQAGFLLDCGISAMAAERMQSFASEAEQIRLSREIKTLTLPGEMGERFQFMALGKNYALPLAGFASQDLSYRL